MKALCVLLFLVFAGCTQEAQNRLSRDIQNWTGTDGVLEIFGDGKIMYRFMQIDKLSTATSADGSKQSRPYRFGYGVLDSNLNFQKDPGEKKVYFEVSDYSTSYIFYENPN